MKQPRIDIIRSAILKQGGNYDLVYYADGPLSDCGIPNSTKVVYKVENFSDGLTREGRERVVEELNNDPRIERAYLSRRYTSSAFRYVEYEGNIKVIFSNRAGG